MFSSKYCTKIQIQYRKLNNELRRITEKARATWWKEQCDELKEMQRKGRHDQVYQKIKQLSTKKNGRKTTAIQDKTGTLLTEPKAVLNRWKEYIEELYNKEEKPDSVDIDEECNTAEDQGPDLLTEEILLALKEMKNNKAEGPDNIPAEMLKGLDGKATAVLIDICKTIYTTGIWPADFVQSIMLPLETKPNATKCEDFRTITLICHAAKILLKVLQKRIEAKVDAVHFLSDDQFGFRRGTGTRDAISTLRVLTERSLEVDRDAYVCFVDYEKAFDRVDWKKLMRVLRRLGVDYRDRRLIGNLYMGQSFTVRIEGEDSEAGIIGRGTRQGCPLSPLLFNIYIQELLNETLDNVTGGSDRWKISAGYTLC